MRVVCLIFPSTVVSVCLCVCLRKKVGGCTFVYVHFETPQSVKKVMEEWVQERQTAKQHQISYFHLWAARRKKKTNEKQKGPTFSTPSHKHQGLV